MGVQRTIRQISSARVGRSETPLRRHHYIPQMLLRRLYRGCRYLEVFSTSGNMKSLGFTKCDNIAYEVGDIRDRNTDVQERWYGVNESSFSSFIDMASGAPFQWVPETRGDDVRLMVGGLIARNPHLGELKSEFNPYSWLNLKKNPDESRIKQTKKLAKVLGDRCGMRFLKAEKYKYWGFGDVPWTIWNDSLVVPVGRNLAIQLFRRGLQQPETIRLTPEETDSVAAAFWASSVNEYYIGLSEDTYQDNKPNGHFIGETYSNTAEAHWEKFHHSKHLKEERTKLHRDK